LEELEEGKSSHDTRLIYISTPTTLTLGRFHSKKTALQAERYELVVKCPYERAGEADVRGRNNEYNRY